jgi:hypothetical protein
LPGDCQLARPCHACFARRLFPTKAQEPPSGRCGGMGLSTMASALLHARTATACGSTAGRAMTSPRCFPLIVETLARLSSRSCITSWSGGSNCIDLVQPAFFFQCAFKQSCRGFDILGRSRFRSRHEHVLHLLTHWPNSEGLGEVLVDHVNRVTQRSDNFG